MKKRKATVEWYLLGCKRPFAYSTISESDGIALLLKDYGDFNKVLNAYNQGDLILSEHELFIIQTFVNNGELNPDLG